MDKVTNALIEYSKTISSKLGKLTGVFTFEETKKKYELIKEDKRWISLSMRRSF